MCVVATGRYFIDRSPRLFRAILEHLRTGLPVTDTSPEMAEVRCACPPESEPVPYPNLSPVMLAIRCVQELLYFGLVTPDEVPRENLKLPHEVVSQREDSATRTGSTLVQDGGYSRTRQQGNTPFDWDSAEVMFDGWRRPPAGWRRTPPAGSGAPRHPVLAQLAVG